MHGRLGLIQGSLAVIVHQDLDLLAMAPSPSPSPNPTPSPTPTPNPNPKQDLDLLAMAPSLFRDRRAVPLFCGEIHRGFGLGRNRSQFPTNTKLKPPWTVARIRAVLDARKCRYENGRSVVVRC